MDEDRTITIELELDIHGDEVRGRALCRPAPPREFVGWLGLFAALDALMAPPGQPPSSLASPPAPQR